MKDFSENPSTALIASAIYRGSVAHQRKNTPGHKDLHAFAQEHWMVLVDLDELERLGSTSLLFGYETRLKPLSIKRRDLPGNPSLSPRAAVAKLLEQHLGRVPSGHMRTLLAPRTWGWLFNPITFTYCYERDGSIGALLMEVTNTPWHEKTHYVVGPPGSYQWPKHMHVSPFLPMEGSYCLSYDAPGNGLQVHMSFLPDGRDSEEEHALLLASLELRRVPFSDKELARALSRHPLGSLRISLGIYANALSLWRKGARFYAHPDPAHRMSIVKKKPFQEGGSHVHERTLLGSLQLKRPKGALSILTGGSTGMAKAYARGDLDTENLTETLRSLMRTLEPVLAATQRAAEVSAPLYRVLAKPFVPNKERNRNDVLAHYDISNEFFQLMLDPTMTYSCGLFQQGSEDLEEAQRAKIDAVLDLLELNEESSLLEIGTGWGALAIRAAERFGCRITTTTLSHAQWEWTSKLLAERGLGDHVTLLESDYRDLTGQFDAIVSVEMIEAVDWRQQASFLAKCASLLKREGKIALQAIVIERPGEAYAMMRKDLIRKVIFPGSSLPSLPALVSHAERADLRAHLVKDIGSSYPPTLRAWRENLERNWDKALGLGMSEEFLRLWSFYLSYCEAGFLEGHVSDVQVLLKPRR